MAEFGCKFADDVELSGLRLQYKVVCLGFVFDLLSHVVAHCCSVLQISLIKDGLQQYGERALIGGLYRYRNDTNKSDMFNPLKFSC